MTTRHALTAILVGCGGSPTVEPGAPTAPPSPVDAAMAACMAAMCPAGVDATGCAAEKCQVREPHFDLSLERVRYEDGALFVEVTPTLDVGGAGPIAAVREDPFYVGVTAVTPEGEELDLIVQTLIPGVAAGPVVFSADVEQAIDVVLVGLWDEKIEPCDSARSGCQQFGFVLDGPLASWPPGLYTDGTRQRLLTGEVPMRVVVPLGLDARAARPLRGAVAEAMASVAGPFGGTAKIEDAQGPPRAQAEIWYVADADAYAARLLASRLAGPFGQEPSIRHVGEALGTRFEVHLAPPPAPAAAPAP